MTTQEVKKHLIKEHGLTSDMMYVVDDIVLIYKHGCDKLERDNGVVAEVTHLQATPYKGETSVVMAMRGKIPFDDMTYNVVATASPDTTIEDHKHYGEIAEYRCRMRILFKALRLNEIKVMPSDGFIQKDEHRSADIMDNVKKKFEERKKTNRGKGTISKDSKRKKA